MSDPILDALVHSEEVRDNLKDQLESADMDLHAAYDRIDELQSALTAAQAMVTWRCYHCNQVFTDKASAAEHFGDDRNNPRAATCVGMLEAMAGEFERYGVHRNFHNAASVRILAHRYEAQLAAAQERERVLKSERDEAIDSKREEMRRLLTTFQVFVDEVIAGKMALSEPPTSSRTSLSLWIRAEIKRAALSATPEQATIRGGTRSADFGLGWKACVEKIGTSAFIRGIDIDVEEGDCDSTVGNLIAAISASKDGKP
jgi:hypothetical protein